MSTSDGAPSASVAREIAEPHSGLPHIVLLGAGASKATCLSGDRNGRTVPVMAELPTVLGLEEIVPVDLHPLLRTDFEAAYAQLATRDPALLDALNRRIHDYFASLELPDEPTIYDCLLLGLRRKDAIFTFNWDPLLVQARQRLAVRGVSALPDMFFLHGNVAVGKCAEHRTIGYHPGACRRCGRLLEPMRLLYPIGAKDYQDGTAVEGSWKTVQDGLAHAFWFTIFGYSAPASDVEAVRLLGEGWHRDGDKPVQPVEIIDRPGRDHEELRGAWRSVIYRDHYSIEEDFFDSWIARHPRRTLEAHYRQNILGEWIDENPVPRATPSVDALIDWFEPLLAAERCFDAGESVRVSGEMGGEEAERGS